MPVKKEVKSPGKKPAVKKTINTGPKPEVFVGRSPDLSFKKAFKDALMQVGKFPEDNSKYEVIKIEFEKGIIPKVGNLVVTIKRVGP